MLHLTCDRSLRPTIDRTIGLRVPRLIVRSVTGCHECSYDRSQDATIARTIGRRMQRLIDRNIGRRPSRLIVHRSMIATTSLTILYDGFCHRYSPIVRDSATTRRDRSRYADAVEDRREGGMTVIHILIGMFNSNPMIPPYLNNNLT